MRLTTPPSLPRRAFLVGAALAAVACTRRAPRKPAVLPPTRVLYRAKQPIHALCAGDRVHRIVEVVRAASHGRGTGFRLFELDRTTGATKDLAELEDVRTGALALSARFAWFVSDRGLGRVRLMAQGGSERDTKSGRHAPEILCKVPHELPWVAADESGAYAFRGELATNVDLVHVPDTSTEPHLLARGLFPCCDHLVVTPTEVHFYNTLPKADAGIRAVAKRGNGAPARTLWGGAVVKELYQGARGFVVDDKTGCLEVDPATGAPIKTIAPPFDYRMIGVLPGGVVYVERGQRPSRPFGPGGAGTHALHFYEFATGSFAKLFDERDGSFIAAGLAGDKLAFATEHEVSEIG